MSDFHPFWGLKYTVSKPPYNSFIYKKKFHPIHLWKNCNKICLNSIHLRFEIYSIKTTSIIHSFTRRNFILFTCEKVVIKYVWIPSIWGLKSTVWKFILSSSIFYPSIYIRYSPFSDLNGWNPYPTSLTVSVFAVISRYHLPSQEPFRG